MKAVNPNLYPSGGYVFIDADGVSIRGDSWPGVIKWLKNYRARSGQSSGDPEKEVMAQACKNNPALCTEESEAYRVQLKESNLKSRVLGWLQRILALPEKRFVFEHDARNRTGVCASCPFNKALPKGCSSCRAAVEESRKNIIGGRSQDSRAESCTILGEDINSAAWIEQVADANPDLPPHCWRKRTL